MSIVGIDQSYTGFGFCVDGVSKKRMFPLSKYDTDVERLADIRRWLSGWLSVQHNTDPVELVVMEGYANAAKFGREVAGELGGVVKLAVYDALGIPPVVVPPTSLKKFVSGSGAAKKNTMIMHVYKRWGVEFSDDNQADAFALEKFGHAYLAIRDEPKWAEESQIWAKFQWEAVEAVLKPKK